MSKFNDLLAFIGDLGSKISPQKSFLFSSDGQARSCFKGLHWPRIDGALKVLTSFRDVGGHINVSSGANGATLTARLRSGSPRVCRIARLPHTQEQKALLVQMGVLSGRVYGCEVTSAEECALKVLTSSICDVISKRSKRRCNDIVFSTCKRDIEPRAVI